MALPKELKTQVLLHTAVLARSARYPLDTSRAEQVLSFAFTSGSSDSSQPEPLPRSL